MSGLDRLAKLYAKVERARLVEARAAAAACEEVKLLRVHTAAGLRAQEAAAKEALHAGDTTERTVSHVLRAASLVQAQRLLTLEGEREAMLDLAEALHRESRVQAEQMRKIADGIREQEALEEGRRVQAVADDRYGSRLRWKQERLRDEASLM